MSEKIISQNVSRKNMIEAIRDALDVTMERDDNVIVFGEEAAARKLALASPGDRNCIHINHRRPSND